MYVGILITRLRIDQAYSLKDKRQVVRSLTDRLRKRHNISIAEVGDRDLWNIADLGVSMVCGARAPIVKAFEDIETSLFDDFRFECMYVNIDIEQEEDIHGI